MKKNNENIEKFSNNFEILVKFYDTFKFSIPISNDLILKDAGIGGNTFRALKINKKDNYRPSVVFREWALNSYNRLTKKILLEEYIDYDNEHNDLVVSLQNEYKNKKIFYSNRDVVPYTVCAKFVDLFIEFSIRENIDIESEFDRKKISEFLRMNAYVPLDSYTLKAITVMLEASRIDNKFLEFEENNKIINLGTVFKKKYKNLSMGFLYKEYKENEIILYKKIQIIIKQILLYWELDYPIIYFDKYAWDNAMFK